VLVFRRIIGNDFALKKGELLRCLVERHLEDGVLRLEGPELLTQRADNCLRINFHVGTLSFTMLYG